MERETGSTGLIKLSMVAERVAASAHADDGLHAIVQGIKDIFDAQTAAILLLDERGENLHVRASRGLSGSYSARFSRPVGTGILAEVIVGGMALLLPDPGLDHDASREFRLENEFGSAMAVQLSIQHKPVGLLYCDHKDPARFERTDLQVLRCFGILASLAIEKSRLYEEVDRLATDDEITGLYTYNYFRNRLAADIARSVRYGESVGVLVCEIEHLSQVEETFGTPAAHDALRYLAQLMRENTRGVDYAARRGTNQIIVSLVRAERQGIDRVSERIIRLTGEATLSAPGQACPREGEQAAGPEAAQRRKGTRTFKVSVYVAGAVAPEHGRNVTDIMTSLDSALAGSKAKGAGKLVMAAAKG